MNVFQTENNENQTLLGCDGAGRVPGDRGVHARDHYCERQEAVPGLGAVVQRDTKGVELTGGVTSEKSHPRSP
jgi:hypothetical protein